MKKALGVTALIFILNTSIFAELKSFPALNFELIGGPLVSLPKDIKHDATLVVLSFKRPADGVVESWTNTFVAAFVPGGRADYYQVAVIGDAGFIGGFILAGMRGGATEEQKKHLAICWEDKAAQKVKFSVDDDSLIYIYLLDKNGNIVLFKKGLRPSDSDIAEIMSAAGALINPKNKKGAK